MAWYDEPAASDLVSCPLTRVPGCTLGVLPLGLGAFAGSFERGLLGDIGPYKLYWRYTGVPFLGVSF